MTCVACWKSSSIWQTLQIPFSEWCRWCSSLIGQQPDLPLCQSDSSHSLAYSLFCVRLSVMPIQYMFTLKMITAVFAKMLGDFNIQHGLSLKDSTLHRTKLWSLALVAYMVLQYCTSAVCWLGLAHLQQIQLSRYLLPEDGSRSILQNVLFFCRI